MAVKLFFPSPRTLDGEHRNCCTGGWWRIYPTSRPNLLRFISPHCTVHSTQVNQPHRFFLWCEAIVCNVVQLSLGHYMWAPPKSSDQTSSSQLVQLQNYKFHQNSEPDQLAVYKTGFAEDIIRRFSRKLQVSRFFFLSDWFKEYIDESSPQLLKHSFSPGYT